MDAFVVLRIQDADGRGPWKPGFSRQWVEDRPDHEDLPPWFVEFGRVDKLALVGEHVGSGCRTLEQLRRWFSPTEYATLRRFGYRAVRMAVGRLLAESDRQCFFGRARPLREDVEPVELYEHNAPADLPAVAGKVRRDVGQINPDERITVEGVEILRYTEGCDGTIFDHAAAGGPPTRCIRCDRWTSLSPYCPRCIAVDLKLPNSFIGQI